MKKNEVKTGRKYLAKVSDRLTTVRIDRTHKGGGWHATNTATGKSIHIKSAQRLRGPAKIEPAGKPTAKAAKATKATVKKPPAKKDAKRMSALDAAAQVLRDTGKPMRAKEMVEVMAAKGLWSSPNGKTPHATLYAAMMRETTVKGDASRFRKVDRGQFEFNG
ncbi:MAG: hypothetical protein GY842_27615 [bacterium]|nr:hypothetical protein [bacterium]